MSRSWNHMELRKSVRRGSRRPTMVEEPKVARVRYTRKEKYRKDWMNDVA